MTDRSELRQLFRTRRLEIEGSSRLTAERAISDHIDAYLDSKMQDPGTVAAYLAVKGEVDLECWLDQTTHRVVLPRVADDGVMTFHRWSPGDALVLNRFRIAEPRPDAPSPDVIDFALAPCVAFDEEGHRLGMGGGFYDRFFATHSNVPLIGIAFEAQRSDDILPNDAWDVSLVAAVTENGVLEF